MYGGEWVGWLQSRGFYAVLVLALLVVGLLLARSRGGAERRWHKQAPRAPARRSGPGKRRSRH